MFKYGLLWQTCVPRIIIHITMPISDCKECVMGLAEHQELSHNEDSDITVDGHKLREQHGGTMVDFCPGT